MKRIIAALVVAVAGLVVWADTNQDYSERVGTE